MPPDDLDEPRALPGGEHPAPRGWRRGPLATAGGCLASAYLATWVLARLHGLEAAERAMHYIAPVGERALRT